MQEVYHTQYGSLATVQYFNPGCYLQEDELVAMHKKLLDVNASLKTAIIHPMLNPQTTVDELRKIFASIIVCLVEVEEETLGFLISPILRRKNITVFHGGLVVITNNPGVNLLMLATVSNTLLAYRKLGRCFITNISSTPAIIEAFTKLMSDAWPSPKSKLIRPKPGFKEAAQLLFEDYVTASFSQPEALEIDYRRFVMRSSSNAMGFNTKFHQISRSEAFSYLSFCFTWLDYDKQEDILQVATLGISAAIKSWLIIMSMKILSLVKKPRPARHQVPSKDERAHPIMADLQHHREKIREREDKKKAA